MEYDVVSIGNANIDIVVYVKKVPEADEAIEAFDYAMSPGGSASNFAVSAQLMGAKACFVGCVGEDYFGEMVLSGFRSAGVSVEYVKFSKKPTGIVFIIVGEEGVRRMIAYRGANLDLEPGDLRGELFDKTKIVHVASVRIGIALKASVEASRRGLKFSYDPGFSATERGIEALKPILSRTHVLYLNTRELANLVGVDDPLAAEKILPYGPKIIVVKLGSRGSFIVTKYEKIHVPPYRPMKVVDTTGAGDVFAAAFTIGLLEGYSLHDSALLGSIAAGIKISGKGARSNIPDRRRVFEVFEKVKRKLESEIRLF